MSEQKISFIKGSQGDIAVHDWGHDQPRFLALLVHGYGEHLGRYQYVARTLEAQGARVFGPDHLGHGLSQGERVLIEDYDAVVDDVNRVVEHFKALHPDLSLVVIGHSMGGMIATRYVQRYGDNVRALVLSGPLIGERTQISDLLELPKIPDEPLDTATLSRDPAVGEAYQADALVWHGPFKRPTLHAMQQMLAKINTGPGFGTLPTLWIHGDDDRLVLMAQSQTAINLLKGNDFEVMINPGGRHESFNETNKDQILRRIGDFIERVLG
ncbi:alpha/beta hydrolase [Serratia quinivorans]|uniref:alpha/beta hydrolase n=1 Tax=Serratia quinivorans TaxID=137545 RepID=UPI0021780BF7|nr:alpha/beta hydrolase [Serratia quinivorans]CAI0958081.1 Phospholipase ytpA [Serratia quinivorans]CAI1761664.1 Phospholipase ytpA [Serratia quinivorans]